MQFDFAQQRKKLEKQDWKRTGRGGLGVERFAL